MYIPVTSRLQRCVLQVIAVVAKVAFKAASGLALPISEFLNMLKEGIGEELAYRALDEEALSRVLSRCGDDERIRRLVKGLYDDLKRFMRQHDFRVNDYVH